MENNVRTHYTPLRDDWTPFLDGDQRLSYMRSWGLVTPKGTREHSLLFREGYLGGLIPCKVVGYTRPSTAVVETVNGLQAVNGEYLMDMQPSFARLKLPQNVWLGDVLADYVVVDIETTGFSRESDDLIEVSAQRYQFGQLAGEFSSLINPHRELPKRIVSLTGITQADVDSAPDLADVASGVIDFIGSLPLVGHNIKSFDFPFLQAHMMLSDSRILVDTRYMAEEAFPMLPNRKLEYMKQVFHLSDGPSHRAMEDVKVTNALLWACLSPRRYKSAEMNAYLEDLLCTKKKKFK